MVQYLSLQVYFMNGHHKTYHSVSLNNKDEEKIADLLFVADFF